MTKALLKYSETPVFELKTEITERFGVKLLVKREDLNHSEISGNKWWKLKYNLEEALRQGKKTLLTFGGAYSNHIYATAAAASELGMKSIGIIRGEETFPLNPTLSFAQKKGMQLEYISREDYRNKTNQDFINNLTSRFGDFYLIPEGGTNELAIKGCTEFGKKLANEIRFDYLCLSVGTGGTIAGLIEGLNEEKKIIGIPVLKGATFLEEEIIAYTSKKGWELKYDYHFGGYAKTTNDLLAFKDDFENKYQIPTDRIYTAKLMYAIFDMLNKNFFREGSTIMILHTGGLQGEKSTSPV